MITIKDLTQLVAKLCRFDGAIEWDATKPDGQPRRCLDVTRAERTFGFRAQTKLEDGLRKAIEWFEANLEAIPERQFETSNA